MQCLMIRPKSAGNDPLLDPKRDFAFVRKHITEGWGGSLSVDEVDFDRVFTALCDCVQLTAALCRNIDKLHRRISETVL